MFLISDSIFVQTKKSGDSPISFRMYTDSTKSSKEVQLENTTRYYEDDSYTFVRLELKKNMEMHKKRKKIHQNFWNILVYSMLLEEEI